MPFIIGESRSNPDKPLPDYVVKNSLTKILDHVDAEATGLLPIPTIALPPIPQVGDNAAVARTSLKWHLTAYVSARWMTV